MGEWKQVKERAEKEWGQGGQGGRNKLQGGKTGRMMASVYNRDPWWMRKVCLEMLEGPRYYLRLLNLSQSHSYCPTRTHCGREHMMESALSSSIE